ncbi:hypothetical protein AL066_25950 [Pseudomonas nunensis]|nr:hypothetical protein AL066_25950 [Pseudomonas nunensis]
MTAHVAAAEADVRPSYPLLNVTPGPVAAVEQREAAFGGEAVVKSGDAVFQRDRVIRFDDGFAAERSLAGSAAATGKRLYLRVWRWNARARASVGKISMVLNGHQRLC